MSKQNSDHEPDPEPDADGLDSLEPNHPDSIIESDDGPGVGFADLEDSRPDTLKKSGDPLGSETKESGGGES